jgi:ABC-2 type transport system ATP-binding protein
MLKIESLTKRYGEFKAVDHLSLHIAPGEIYGFIGHNGAGKTTTLKSIAGILPFEEGNIYVNGMSIQEKPLECKKIMAYIPDNPDLYEYLTGIKYLNFIADVYKVGNKERNERIHEYAKLLNL